MSAYLDIPPGARTDKQASELIRAWAAHGGLQCSLNVDAWSGDQTTIGWGILLSDIAQQNSPAYRGLIAAPRVDIQAALQSAMRGPRPNQFTGLLVRPGPGRNI